MRRTWADYAHSGLITHILPDDGLMTHSTDINISLDNFMEQIKLWVTVKVMEAWCI